MLKLLNINYYKLAPLPFISFLKVAISPASHVSWFKSFQSLLAKLIDVQWSHLRLASVLRMLNLDLELYPWISWWCGYCDLSVLSDNSNFWCMVNIKHLLDGGLVWYEELLNSMCGSPSSERRFLAWRLCVSFSVDNIKVDVSRKLTVNIFQFGQRKLVIK